ncbi:hypothetical protein ACFSTC_29355 [Nonomuraea ferruginea]
MNAQGVEVERRVGRSVMAGLHGMWSVGNFAGGSASAWRPRTPGSTPAPTTSWWPHC